MEAKQAVEVVAARHGMAVQGAGCGGVLVVSIAVALAAMAVVAALMLGQ